MPLAAMLPAPSVPLARVNRLMDRHRVLRAAIAEERARSAPDRMRLDRLLSERARLRSIVDRLLDNA